MELEYEKELPKWHPIRNYQREARNILHILQEIDSIQNFADRILITNLVHQLSQIEIRFHRKENQLFPYLEKHGWLGPSQGMWSFHDQIRAMLKDIREQIQNFSNQDLQNNLNYVVNEIRRLITIEQHRLLKHSVRTQIRIQIKYRINKLLNHRKLMFKSERTCLTKHCHNLLKIYLLNSAKEECFRNNFAQCCKSSHLI